MMMLALGIAGLALLGATGFLGWYFTRLRTRLAQAEAGKCAFERRSRQMFEENSAIAYFLDPQNGRIVMANEAARKFWGYPTEMLYQMAIWDINQASEQALWVPIRTALSIRQYDLVGQHRLHSGELRDVEVHGSLIDFDDRQLIYCITFDVSARRRAEREVERLALVATKTTTGVVITDPLGRIEWVNRAFTEMSGFSTEECLGQKPGDLLQGPDTDPATVAFMRQQLSRQCGFAVDILNYHRDGRPHWQQLKVDPVFDAEGQLTQYIGIETDITERKEAEAALRAGEEKWSFAVEGAGDGVWDWNIQTGATTFSRRWLEMLGYNPAEISAQAGNGSEGNPETGHHIDEWTRRIHPDDLRRVLDALNEHLDGHTASFASEQRILCQDGHHKWILSRGKLISRDAQGRPERIIGTYTDISAMKAMSEAVMQKHDLLMNLAQQVPGVIYQLQRFPDGRFCFPFASEAIEEIFEVPHQAVEHDASPVFAMLHPDDDAETLASIEASARNLTPWQHEFRVHLPRRGVEWRLGNARPQPGPGGSILWHGLITDITARKAREEAFRLTTSVFENSGEAIVVTDPENRIVAVNPAFTRITGYSFDDVVGQDPKILSAGTQSKAFYQAMWNQILAEDHFEGELTNRRKNGTLFTEWASINTVRNAKGEVERRFAIFSDITEKKAKDELILRQASFDALTGLPNRRLFMDRLQQEIKASRRSGERIALLFIDLDMFKEINDTLGHQHGDTLLVEVAQRLVTCVRESDTTARLGGDEFTVVLPGLNETSAKAAESVAQKIIRAITRPFVLGSETVHISASIGITVYPVDAPDMEGLLKNADQAMYKAKAMGRNRFSYFTIEMQQTAQARLQLGNDLRQAMAGQQLMVYYQPIVHLTTGRLVKAEALLRWQHPKRGMVSPAEFIPLAEELGLITEIGDWVFRESARCVKSLRTLGTPENGLADLQISVNKSPRQFLVGNTHETWLTYLTNINLPSDGIVIEITEGMLLDDHPEVKEKLRVFGQQGVQISLDDFGTGFSAMGYLQKFPLDYLKVDQSFVRNMVDDEGDQAIVEAIIVMAHKLGLKVVAEGVETEAQRQMLAAAGCDYGQGYLFSRPIPEADFRKFITQWQPSTASPPKAQPSGTLA